MTHSSTRSSADISIGLAILAAPGPGPDDRRCRVCGCADEECETCIIRTGEPCFWIEDNLCSACAGGAGCDGF